MVARAGPLDHAAHRAGGAEPHRRLLSAIPVGARAPLRVALDLGARRLDRAGVARYATNLFAALRARADVEVVGIGDGPYASAGMDKKLTVLRQDLLWHPWLARRAARAAGAAVYHAPSPRAPLSRGRPATAVSLHDLNFVQRPDTVSSWNGRYSRATIRRVLAAADRILCISQATADDLDHLLGVDGTRVRVVYLGVDDRWFEAVPAEDAPPYVLAVGTVEPRKNLARAVAAVALRRRRGAPERLRVVGAAGWGAVALPTGDDAELLGRVEDARLHALYAGAACLVVPSLHEGFGLTALEAMAAGCPVVAARAGALPEVCGDAAVLVNPLDAADIARGIDEAIARTDDLRARGHVRARAFTWAACADQTVSVYRELV